MAILYPSDRDQYQLELVNRARLDPEAEAARLQINLNEGLAPGTISTNAKQPLAFNLNLNAAANGHSQWMLDNNIFSHTGEDNTNPGERMENEGYTFTPTYGSGENLAWKGTTGTLNFTTFMRENHENLFIDSGIPGRGHRVSLMNGNFQEVGISSLQGQFQYNGNTYNTVMTAQDFAYSAASGPFITGVAYTDNVTNDNFYTVGEGISGIIVTAVDINNSANNFTTTTWDAGGYSLDVNPNATYNVTFSGDLDQDGQGGDTATYQVTVGSENVKQDVVSDNLPPQNVPTPGDDNLNVDGTTSLVQGLAGNDTLTGSSGGDSIDGREDNDVINGELGNDYLLGGDGLDILNGSDGNDFLKGQSGNDTIYGGDGNDTAGGGADNDTIYGGAGNDSLNAWIGNDYFIGGTGNDIISGQEGLDTLIGVEPTAAQPGNNEIDTLDGGADADADLFILGDGQVYYDHNGTPDYALIRSFNGTEGDRIQLYGSISDYTLPENVTGLPAGTAIYSNGDSELIAIVKGFIGIDLSHFSFVD